MTTTTARAHVVHLVPGPEGHGVTRHALDLLRGDEGVRGLFESRLRD